MFRRHETWTGTESTRRPDLGDRPPLTSDEDYVREFMGGRVGQKVVREPP